MADVLTKEQRHKNMSHIRAKDTKPEIVLRKALWHKGYRYRKNWNKMPGKPDIVLTKYKICIFVDSEFFHGKGFYGGYESKKYKSLEEQLQNSTHPEFWITKIKENMKRDEKVNEELKKMGWTVLRFWSKDALKNTKECVKTVEETIFDRKFDKDDALDSYIMDDLDYSRPKAGVCTKCTHLPETVEKLHNEVSKWLFEKGE